MRTIKRIFLGIIIGLFVIVASIVLFRNEVVLGLISYDQSKRMAQPFTMLEIPAISDSLYQALAADFDRRALPPEEYLLEVFKTHDCVFLGENHRYRHDLEFMGKMIPILYRNGIRSMGFEFALHQDSTLIREVIDNRDFFDQEKANRIVFRLSPYWGYKEYVDLFRSAWEVNRSLPADAERFMIHGIMHEMDYSQMRSRKDEFNEDAMLKVRKGVDDPERFMADAILTSLVGKNRKAIVYCGVHHAFSGYEGNGDRVGVYVKRALGDRVATVVLHYPWNSKKGASHMTGYPAGGAIDAFVRRHKTKDYAFGIDVAGTAFGGLVDTSSVYATDSPLKLGDFCDGYIYLKPFGSYENVSIQKDFINDGNFAYARTQLPNPELRDGILFRYVGPKVYSRLVAIDNIEYPMRHLY